MTWKAKSRRLHLLRYIVACCLLICGYHAVRSQTIPLPAKYYQLKTVPEQLKFLKKTINDSVNAGRMAPVPSWSHYAIVLAHGAGADSMLPVFYECLGDAYNDKQNDSAIHYYRLALTCARHPSVVNRIYLQQSLLYCYTALDKRDSVLAYLKELEKSITALPDTNSGKLTVINSMAISYESMNNYAKAINLFRFIVHNALIIKDSNELQNAFINIGTAYNETGNDTLATWYTMQALPYMGNKEDVKLVAYGNLSNYFLSVGKPDSANIFLRKAEQLPSSKTNEDVKMYLGMRRAAILVYEKKYAEAAPLLEKSLQYYEKRPTELSLINTLLIYVQLDTCLHNYEQAKVHLMHLYDVTKDRNLIAYRTYTLQFLSAVAAKQGDYKAAYDYQQQYITLNNEYKSELAAQSFAELQAEYQAYRSKEQIDKLNKENRIKDLKLQVAFRNKIWYIILTIFLLITFSGIFYLRQLKNKAALQQVRSSLEMKALRSQMNPHFIFNSLNSIQKYIWENKQEDAAEYLTRFARLIRLVLENSQHQNVLLTEDLAALRLYVDMEHRRNNNKFDYSISLAEDVNADQLLVPPLLLQPYVENAIWHGLSQKEGRGNLTISVHRQDGFLICTITDDGIGRAKAAQIKQSAGTKTSLAMNISAQRIDWINKDTGAKASVQIRDLYDEKNNAAGTTVTIYLPLIFKHD